MPDTNESFPAIARRKLAFLIDERAFRVVEEREEVVRFESSKVSVTATCYEGDHGQVDVIVAPLGIDDLFTRLTITGMIGRASLARVLELAAEKLRLNEPALNGDEAYYTQLAEAQRLEGEKWTAYYSGKGPQPTGKLPP